jgi:hypothetical protein
MRSWFLALWEFGSGPVCLCESGVPLAFHSEPLPVGSGRNAPSRQDSSSPCQPTLARDVAVGDGWISPAEARCGRVVQASRPTNPG